MSEHLSVIVSHRHTDHFEAALTRQISFRVHSRRPMYQLGAGLIVLDMNVQLSAENSTHDHVQYADCLQGRGCCQTSIDHHCVSIALETYLRELLEESESHNLLGSMKVVLPKLLVESSKDCSKSLRDLKMKLSSKSLKDSS